MEEQDTIGGINSIVKLSNHFEIQYDTEEQGRLYILNSHVFRLYMTSNGEFIDHPEPNDKEDVAKIVPKYVDEYDKEHFDKSNVKETEDKYLIETDHIKISFMKDKGMMKVDDKRHKKEVLREARPLSYNENKSTQVIVQYEDEHYYGGGMQNGRFAHKGEVIKIVNTNKWDDGGVTSPNPFYWSTYGYGVLRNTWQPGTYDFGSKNPKHIKTTHKEGYFDAFYFVSSSPRDILFDYYELTGHPILLPEFAFYEAHLNAFNRDYWVLVTADTPGAILFEDGEYYKCYQPSQMGDKKGILESLNGENNNYQFSARAMIDRYQRHDMPLGWFIPNDGYGCGYGQTDTLEGDLENLEEFTSYSRSNGVEAALWTESNLAPKDPEHPKKGERDLVKEVGKAGVVALKCDVAWIGSGYSFGLSAVEKATDMFKRATKNNARPLIIMVDGWAGTQRYAGIWSGDQSGGEWEYIRFHIPTYIGTGLSGQPIVGSDMDGIYRGGNKEVNVRDYQWKTFTPLQLNMDGWGSIPKTPFSYDDEATDINRAYLKQKSMLMPYNYSISHESIHGLPMIRAMFLEFPKELTAHTNDSKYQYMWGPDFLVAPIYKSNFYRDGVYLPNPDQIWIDFFTGEMYQGGKIYNNLDTPLWKLPVFVKNGAIIPMTNSNNNPYEIQRDNRILQLYPCGESKFEIYEDDGQSSDYEDGHFAKTKVKMVVNDWSDNELSDLHISIDKTVGKYKGMVKDRTTLLRIMTTVDHVKIHVETHGHSIHIAKAATEEEFNSKDDVYFIKDDFVVNTYLQHLAGDKIQQKFLLLKLRKMDVNTNKIHIKMSGFANKKEVFGSNSTLNTSLDTPSNIEIDEEGITSTSVRISWNEVSEANYYEVERDGVIFSNITDTAVTFDGFKYSTEHNFRVRSVNNGVSEWSEVITGLTKEDPFKYVIKDVKVSCNLPCQPSQEISNLTDGGVDTFWHTDWGTVGKFSPCDGYFLKLNFDLGEIHKVDKMEYVPRDDAGNGTFLKLQLKYSIDETKWSSPVNISWNLDPETKMIELNGTEMRFVELIVLDTIGSFGSGRNIHFYKKI